MSLSKVGKFFVFIMLLVSGGALAAAGIFKDFDGGFHSVSEYTGDGKWLVVMLWASDCHVCNQEAHSYQAFHEKHKDKDARMLGISLDGMAGKADAQAFVKRHKVLFPNLLGDPKAVAGFYQDLTGKAWRGTPTFLVYDGKGELQAEQVGAVPVALIEDFMAREGAK